MLKYKEEFKKNSRDSEYKSGQKVKQDSEYLKKTKGHRKKYWDSDCIKKLMIWKKKEDGDYLKCKEFRKNNKEFKREILIYI